MRSSFQWTRLLILLLLLPPVFMGCRKKPVEERPSPIEVEVLRVFPRDVAEHFMVGGLIKAEETAVVTAEIGGTIQKQFFREGDRVKAGEVLLRFDPEPFSLALAKASANFFKAKVGFENRRDEFERREKLNTEGFLPNEKVEAARLLFRSAKADLEVARSNLRLAERALRKTRVRSPLTGVIVARNHEIGEQVSPGTPLFRVDDTRRIRIPTGLSEEQVLTVSRGEKVPVHVAPFRDRVFQGTIERISFPPSSAQGGVFPVDVVLENPKQLLRPGMTASVEFTGTVHREIFLVPRNAVLERMGEKLLYRIREGKAVDTPVLLGDDFGFDVEITKGLSTGDQVVIIGQDQVYPGADVKIRRISGETGK